VSAGTLAPRPLDARLFAELTPPTLQGSRCEGCGTTVFPVATSCPRCGEARVEPVPLPRRGVLWSWTWQTFAPRPPYEAPEDEFVPFAVGYVDLGDVIVETRLEIPEDAHIGMPLECSTVTVGWDEGRPVVAPSYRSTEDTPA
jgi:uncharacterized protein